MLARPFAARRRVAAPIPIVASLRHASNPPLPSSKLHLQPGFIHCPARFHSQPGSAHPAGVSSFVFSFLVVHRPSSIAAVISPLPYSRSAVHLSCLRACVFLPLRLHLARDPTRNPTLSAVSVSVSVLPVLHPWILSFPPLFPCSSRVPLYVPRDSARYCIIHSWFHTLSILRSTPLVPIRIPIPSSSQPRLVRVHPPSPPDVSAPESVSIPHPASSSSVEIDKTHAHIFLFPVSL
ncbi:hypothetical protein DFH09DRAFT_1320170 [Mycena vulgaris]|nr:hypothetical protein DFH09DRAFT_1320170 [Mycena vulgaris]